MSHFCIKYNFSWIFFNNRPANFLTNLGIKWNRGQPSGSPMAWRFKSTSSNSSVKRYLSVNEIIYYKRFIPMYTSIYPTGKILSEIIFTFPYHIYLKLVITYRICPALGHKNYQGSFPVGRGWCTQYWNGWPCMWELLQEGCVIAMRNPQI